MLELATVPLPLHKHVRTRAHQRALNARKCDRNMDSNCSAQTIAKLIIKNRKCALRNEEVAAMEMRERKFERTIITLFGESKLAQLTPRLRRAIPARTLFRRSPIVQSSTMHFPREKSACSHLKLHCSQIYLFNFRSNGCLIRRSTNENKNAGRFIFLFTAVRRIISGSASRAGSLSFRERDESISIPLCHHFYSAFQSQNFHDPNKQF